VEWRHLELIYGTTLVYVPKITKLGGSRQRSS